jgi:UDP-N-acetylglucosamine acyltransferase
MTAMAPEIHPTAIIEDGAVIGEDCRIGPYCIVGPNVTLGKACRLHSHAVIDGNTTLGDGCQVFSFACLGKVSQDLKYRGGNARVVIGSGCTFREYVTVHASTADGGKTELGDGCHILAYCHIAHDCALGDRVIMSNGTNLAGHVVAGDDAVFGGLAGVHQFVRIGRMAMIGASARLGQDVPPYCLAEGWPAACITVNRIGMERHGLSKETIQSVHSAYKVVFRSGSPLQGALEQLRERFPGVAHVEEMIEFIEGSERGLARPKTS